MKDRIDKIKAIYKQKQQFDLVIDDILGRLERNAELGINSLKIRNFYTDKVKDVLLANGLKILETSEEFVDHEDYNRGVYTENYWIISYD